MFILMLSSTNFLPCLATPSYKIILLQDWTASTYLENWYHTVILKMGLKNFIDKLVIAGQKHK